MNADEHSFGQTDPSKDEIYVLRDALADMAKRLEAAERDAAQQADKLQQLLDDVRKARAAEHLARQNVATIKGQVKTVEATYNEAQRVRQKAVDKLLSAIDAESHA